MEKKTSQKVRLGIFVIMGLLIFVLAAYFIGSKQNMFGKNEHLYTVFNNVNGLQLGNNVRYSGINVGTVKEIKMLNDTMIRIDMGIDKNIFRHIKKDANASISSDGLVGNMIVNIAPGKGNGTAVEPGSTIGAFTRVRAEDIMNTLSTTTQSAAKVTDDLQKITKEIIEGRGTLGVLVKDAAMADDLRQTMNYLKLTSKGTTESIANLNKIIYDLNKKENVIGVLKDTAVGNQIRKIVNNLNRSGDGVDKVVSNLNKVILNIKDGKGAINYLSNDVTLVKKIDSTMSNVNSASKNLNEDLEALKHNFLFRGYFRKKEKEKQREQEHNQKK